VVVVSYAACMRWWPVPGMWDEPLFAAGPGQFDVINPGSIPAFYALAAQRHMHEFGTTREQLAEIAVTCRANAANNPDARYRDPLTIEEVLEAPMVASPLGRFDCCVVTDSGGAFVVTSAERARDCRKQPVSIAGFGEANATVQMSQMRPLTASPARLSGPKAFAMAGVKHEDIDVAQLYDAFTITPLVAIEDLGFCEKGDGGPFVQEGNIRPDGALPINTDGGGLSSNHPGKRGVFVVIEAVRQLRGEGPGVQIEGAKTALCNGNGGFLSAAATLILAT
jgi:acetyl-CoA C-acetyltransferase